MSDQFTILIQGPLNNVSLENIENYKKFGNVIISHWDLKHSIIEKKFPILKKYKSDPKVKIISKPLPERNDKVGIQKGSTFYWAVESCYHGFMACESEYVIKTRSDEYFSDLTEIINETTNCKGSKFVCGSIFVRNYAEFPFHVGDHIFCLKTEHAQKMYQHFMDMYNGKKPLESWAIQGKRLTPRPGKRKLNVCAEQILGFCFARNAIGLKSENIVAAYMWAGPREFWIPNDIVDKKKYENEKAEQLQKEGQEFLKANPWASQVVRFGTRVVDINSLGDYQVCWAHRDKIWSSKGKKFTNRHGIDNQEDFESFFNNHQKCVDQTMLDKLHSDAEALEAQFGVHRLSKKED
tara:strand:- start:4428 stop:5480 length:1053 start_codon:yes stop_codon:yes gene_type:complete